MQRDSIPSTISFARKVRMLMTELSDNRPRTLHIVSICRPLRFRTVPRRAGARRADFSPQRARADTCRGLGPLIVRQVREKSEASDTIGGDPVTVDDRGAVEELAQVIPVEVPAILEFLDQTCRIESIPRLPQFQHDNAADQRLVERSRGEHAEIVDVARHVALILRWS